MNVEHGSDVHKLLATSKKMMTLVVYYKNVLQAVSTYVVMLADVKRTATASATVCIHSKYTLVLA